MNKEELLSSIKELGISINTELYSKLLLFADLLLQYNKNVNITSIRNINEVYLKHIYDSLTLVKGINLNKKITILDVGSGGGFPGIVIGIVFPNLKITLVDSNHKKTDFQNYIINKLSLNNIETINDRVENYFKKGIKYDVVVARAVANLTVLSELCIPFVNINGYFIAMKGDFKEEIDDAKYAIDFLGGSLEKIITFKLPISFDIRNLVVVRKIRNTKDGYPRKYDHIIKKPLIK